MATTERLPGLRDEAPATAASRAPTQQAGSMWPWYLLLLLLIAAVGAGAWWLSQGREARAPELPAEQSLPIPVTPAPEADAVPADTGSSEAPADADAAAQPAIRADAAQSPQVVQPSTGLRPVRADRERTERSRSTADEPAPPPPAFGPAPPVAYTSRPYGGRVVQLGAFPTRDQAEDSWKRITRRYPYLLTKSKMVNTVDVQGLGGGRPTRMYRLQLGTSSQAQSVVICQQLERAGHSCVVVY